MMPWHAVQEAMRYPRRFSSPKPHYWLGGDGLWRRSQTLQYPVMFGASVRTIRDVIELESRPVKYIVHWTSGG